MGTEEGEQVEGSQPCSLERHGGSGGGGAGHQERGAAWGRRGWGVVGGEGECRPSAHRAHMLFPLRLLPDQTSGGAEYTDPLQKGTSLQLGLAPSTPRLSHPEPVHEPVSPSFSAGGDPDGHPGELAFQRNDCPQ